MSAGGRKTMITSHRRGAGGLVARALAVTLAACGMVASALAQEMGGVDEAQISERIAFEAADTDGDGRVSEAELARDAAAGFSGLDRDRSRTLTPEELGPHDPAKFARVDADGDGKLTFVEVMTYKTKAFEKADRDNDGSLSYQEMHDAVAAEAKE
jgi:Ca2+-binding EF-hand superfamily protein